MDMDVGLIGWVGVRLGGTYGYRCDILYLAVIYGCDLLTKFTSPYSLNAHRG